ncbi:hypothetical protein LEMLEM_LOCUS18867, partial [Lemmus lemmus]
VTGPAALQDGDSFSEVDGNLEDSNEKVEEQWFNGLRQSCLAWPWQWMELVQDEGCAVLCF